MTESDLAEAGDAVTVYPSLTSVAMAVLAASRSSALKEGLDGEAVTSEPLDMVEVGAKEDTGNSDEDGIPKSTS